MNDTIRVIHTERGSSTAWINERGHVEVMLFQEGVVIHFCLISPTWKPTITFEAVDLEPIWMHWSTRYRDEFTYPPP